MGTEVFYRKNKNSTGGGDEEGDFKSLYSENKTLTEFFGEACTPYTDCTTQDSVESMSKTK